MNKNIFYDRSVFALSHSKTLNTLNQQSAELEENCSWRTAKKCLLEAKAKGLIMPVIFSPAEATLHLHSWASLESIEIKNKTTLYRFSNLIRFKKPIPKTKLIIYNAKKPISIGQIRSYVVCCTPDFLPLSPSGLLGIKKDFTQTDVATPPDKYQSTITRIIRDTSKAKELKQLYKNKCQVCGESILSGGMAYSEVHHIRPLGGDHKGVDELNNMIVLCPNHHAYFDFGVPEFLNINMISIGRNKYNLTIKHEIHRDFIEYHNKRLRGKSS